GNDKNVLFVRYATFGIGATSFPWTNFKRPKTTIELTEEKAEQTLIDTLITRILSLEARPQSNVPIGLIAIWDRPANVIPTGWIEYQALRGRMPIGLDPNDPELDGLGTYDGAKNKRLSIKEMPEHTHGGVPTRVSGEPDAGGLQCNFDLNNTGNTLPQGSGQEFSIMNPYRVVHFIKYIG
ncbi:hypothetical protein LIS90_13845, partial [Flavobacterium psychrophilum]|nr:hypothetical protein [Flavobacterium psychrophilum]